MQRQQTGISLIETLVTLVIISIGMLGIAALYVESLQIGSSAVSRTRAVALAADMADRIRSNPAGRASYEADDSATASNPPFACAETAVAIAVDCAPAELAAYDIWQWKTLIGNSPEAAAMRLGLPNGTGSIRRDDSTLPTTFVITINWSDRGDAQRYSLALAI
jgi:type IV pilus assembly protein PilV